MVLDLYGYCDYSDMCDRLKSVEPLTPWDSIQIGHVYHIPAILNYDRRDFKVDYKDDNKIQGQILSDGKSVKPYQYSFFRSELSSRFIVEKLN